MNIKILGAHLLSSSSLANLEAEAIAAGHTIVKDDVSTLVSAAEEKFPALVQAFKTGFDEVENDTSVSGVAKMGKVVAGIIPQLPTIAAELVDLPNVESFLLQMGQTLWTKTLSELEAAAAKLVTEIL